MGNQVLIDKNLLKYLETLGYRSDLVIDELVNETKKLGKVAQMQISPEQSKFLELLVNISNSKRCLEIGTFTGLSSLSMARGLSKDGKVLTIDISNEFLALAKKFWIKAGVDQVIKATIGSGLDVMQSLIDRQDFFDFIFIDADKNNYPNYYELGLKLLSANGIILIDNMLWHGDVANKKKQNKATNTIRKLNLKIQKDKRVDYVLLPLSDGISFIRKKD